MKSTLKIALHSYDGPMILASVSTDRDDLRDDVMNKFFSSLEGNFITECTAVGTREQSCLCFVEGFGREREPESYVYTIHPITPGEEVKYINRLQLSQARRIIPLALQMLHPSEQKAILTEYAVCIPADNTLPSNCQIEDSVCTDEIFDGEVTAIRFTTGKVYYDILDKLSGKVIRDIDSAHIHEPAVKLPQAVV